MDKPDSEAHKALRLNQTGAEGIYRVIAFFNTGVKINSFFTGQVLSKTPGSITRVINAELDKNRGLIACM